MPISITTTEPEAAVESGASQQIGEAASVLSRIKSRVVDAWGEAARSLANATVGGIRTNQEGSENAVEVWTAKTIQWAPAQVLAAVAEHGLGVSPVITRTALRYADGDSLDGVQDGTTAEARAAIESCNNKGDAIAATITGLSTLGGPLITIAGRVAGNFVGASVTEDCKSNIPPEVLALANRAVGGNANQLACTAVDAPDGACVPKANAPTPQRASAR